MLMRFGSINTKKMSEEIKKFDANEAMKSVREKIKEIE